MTVAFVFPGQGSQAVGMGREFYENFSTARAVFEEVDDALKQKLSRLILEGDEQNLTLTANAQPALMTVSLAILKTLENELGKQCSEIGSYVAGHSLGEYSALCAARVFSLTDTAKLLRIRGQAMQEAVPVGQGAMAAILGLELAMIETLVEEIKEHQVCEVANDNSPGQVVISGHVEAVERAMELATAKGAKRALKLSVSAPFHCSLMQSAALLMKQALEEVVTKDADVPVVANVTALPLKEVDLIKLFLVEQITGRVRWRESMLNLVSLGITTIVEIGAGKVLTGLNKRIHSDIEALALNTLTDLETILKKF